AEKALEALNVMRRGDDENVSDARQHKRSERIVDHRLVVDRHKLLRYSFGDRVKTGAAAASKDDALHDRICSKEIVMRIKRCRLTAERSWRGLRFARRAGPRHGCSAV